MKICDIAGFYSEIGGGVKTYHTAKLAYFATRPEHSYIMIVASHRNAMRTVPGGRIYEVRGFPVSKNRAYRQIYDIKELRRIVLSERPDVVEAGSPYADCLLTRIVCRNTNAKTVGFYHADVPDSYIAPAVRSLPPMLGNALLFLGRQYVRHTYRALDATVATSRHIEEKLLQQGVKHLYRIPLGVDTRRFHPNKRRDALRLSLGVGRQDKMLLFAGRFRTEKGIDTLATALPALAEHREYKIVLAGDGPHGEAVRAAASAHENITVIGYERDPEKLSQLYASADLFLAPGPHETFGLAILEAMSSGVPVVGADRGGSAELVSESETGALFRAFDPSDLVRAVETVLSTGLTDQKHRARRFVETGYSWQRTFDRMIAAYESSAPFAHRSSVPLCAPQSPAVSPPKRLYLPKC